MYYLQNFKLKLIQIRLIQIRLPGKAIPKVIKKLIIEAIDAGESVRKVAKRFHVGIASVSRIYKRWPRPQSYRTPKKN